MQRRQPDDMSRYASYGSGRVVREMPLNPVAWAYSCTNAIPMPTPGPTGQIQAQLTDRRPRCRRKCSQSTGRNASKGRTSIPAGTIKRWGPRLSPTRFSLTGADPGWKPSRTDRAPRRQAKNALHYQEYKAAPTAGRHCVRYDHRIRQTEQTAVMPSITRATAATASGLAMPNYWAMEVIAQTTDERPTVRS